MGRSSAHEGSVRRLPGRPGMWQARLPKRLDPHRRPLPDTFPTERLARAALTAAIVDMDRNAGLRPVGRTNGRVRRVRDVLADYIDARKNSALAPIAIRTVRDYRSVLLNHVSRPKADIGHVPVHKLTGRDIRAWMDDLAADGVGPGTIANARRVLGAALAWEVREGRLGVNPATHVRIETSKARRAAMQTVDPVLLPSWSEFATLVEAPELEHDRVLMALLGWCGLRWSEAVSLHEQAIWRDRPQVTIDRVLVRRTQKDRSEAKAEAARRAESQHAQLLLIAEYGRAEEQKQIDQLWGHLLSNDEDVVIATLTEAFADNEAGAVPVSVTDGSVSIVVQLPDMSAVPERKATTTDLGNLSSKKLAKTERNALYGALVAGHLILTVKEAFATAPGLLSAQVVGLRPARTDSYGRVHMECVMAGSWSRQALDRVLWGSSSWYILADTATTLLMSTSSTNELRPLDLAGEPELAAVVASIDVTELSGDTGIGGAH